MPDIRFRLIVRHDDETQIGRIAARAGSAIQKHLVGQGDFEIAFDAEFGHDAGPRPLARMARRQFDAQPGRLELHALGRVGSVDAQTADLLRVGLEIRMEIFGIDLLGWFERQHIGLFHDHREPESFEGRFFRRRVRRLPQVDGAVPAGGGHGLAVRRNRHAEHAILVRHPSDGPATRQIPEYRVPRSGDVGRNRFGPGSGRRCEQRAIPRESDGEHRGGVTTERRGESAGRRVPDIHDLVPPGGGESLAIGRGGDPMNGVLMSLHVELRLSRRDAPNRGSAVGVAGDEQVVGAEGDAEDLSTRALKDGFLDARDGVPNRDLALPIGSREKFAVGREGRGIHRRTGADQRHQGEACRRVADAGRAVVFDRDETLAIGSEGDAAHRTRRLDEIAFLAGGGVPDAQFAGGAQGSARAGRDPFAVGRKRHRPCPQVREIEPSNDGPGARRIGSELAGRVGDEKQSQENERRTGDGQKIRQAGSTSDGGHGACLAVPPIVP